MIREVKHPMNITFDKDRIVGKRVASIVSDASHGGKPAFLILHFDDDTYVRIEQVKGGLSEDFGKGPVPILEMNFFGVREYDDGLKPTVGASYKTNLRKRGRDIGGGDDVPEGTTVKVVVDILGTDRVIAEVADGRRFTTDAYELEDVSG